MWIEERRRRANEQGQGLMEYTLVLMLVTVACAATLTGLGQQIVSVLYQPVASMFG